MKCDWLHSGITERIERGIEDPEITERSVGQGKDKSGNSETASSDEIVELVRNLKISHS